MEDVTTKTAFSIQLSNNFWEAGDKPSITSMVLHYSYYLSHFTDTKALNKNYLFRRNNLPHLITIVDTLLLMTQFKDTPLNEDRAHRAKLFYLIIL
uniref:Uncharacterized protein n=1 Tax=Odontella aurita TaxID=265563 RepID=A0A7S4IXS0_9STRA